ncbi:MAG: FUSC family protein [Clostridium sp.]|uniref:FUSC family protein n=1 Tax=Clostridium sp. TaxID=1506 RepID=UPI003EE44C09
MSKSLAFKAWVLGIIVLITFIPFKLGSNIMVAMASILLVPELAKDDYTEGKLKEIIKLVVVCSILSFCASIFSYHIYLGTFLTFIIGFCIYYFYTYENKESKSMIFMIYYILILSIPMPKGDLGYRMIATVYGAVIAMVLYFLVMRLDFLKIANQKMKKAKEYFNEWEEERDNREKLALALEEIQEAEDLLIKKTEKNSKNKVQLVKKIGVIELIKSLGLTMDEIKRDEIKETLINLIKDGFDFYEMKEEIRFYENINKFIKIYKNEKFIKIIKESYLENINLNEKIEKSKDGLEILKIKKRVLNKYSDELNLNYKFKISMTGIKFNAAIKGAILTSIAVFVVFYFNIKDGRWLLYTITVVYLPFAEQSIKKLSQRIFGTLVGFILFDILLTISQNNIYVCALMLISLYFSIYLIDYGKRAIFITYTGIASQFIMNKSQAYYILSLYRIWYVVLGAIIVFLVIKYIFPINFNKIILGIIESYKRLDDKIYEYEKGKEIINKNEILIISRYLYMKSRYIYKLTKDEKLKNIIESEIVREKNYKLM